MSLLEVRDLTVEFGHGSDAVRAVDGVSFDVDDGEILGMVGESGSGKSVTGLATLGLLQQGTARVSGSARFDGRELLTLSDRQLRAVRGKQLAMIFQEPMSAIDPVFTIGMQIAEVVRTHDGVSHDVAKKRAIEMLEAVGIADPARRYHAYAHQLSGGMRQRAMIAMALVCEPAVLIADEPTTALDVTIEAQILSLLRDLNQRIGTSILLISHDLGVIARLCGRVITMYLGQQVELATLDNALVAPQHPYTSALISSLPGLGFTGERLAVIPGQMPSLTHLPSGCRFRSRCRHALERCADEKQVLQRTEAGQVRCWRHDEIKLPGVFAHLDPSRSAPPAATSSGGDRD